MRTSALLDRGRAILHVYPEVTVINKRGDHIKVPSDKPVEVRVSMTHDTNQAAELPGQVDVKIIKCLARAAPVGTWARIVYQDEEWDLAAPPHRSVGVSKNTAAVSFIIRSRNDAPAGNGLG